MRLPISTSVPVVVICSPPCSVHYSKGRLLSLPDFCVPTFSAVTRIPNYRRDTATVLLTAHTNQYVAESQLTNEICTKKPD